MLILTRESLLSHLLELPPLVLHASARNPDYVEQAAAWLLAVEHTLLRLRHPLTGAVSMERGRVLSVNDGYRPPESGGEKAGLRHLKRIAVTAALGRVEEGLRRAIDSVDVRLGALREKTVQLVAVASTLTPVPLQGVMPRHVWLERVWKELPITEETRTMYHYLSASLGSADMLSLLGEVLDNLLSHAPRTEEEPG